MIEKIKSVALALVLSATLFVGTASAQSQSKLSDEQIDELLEYVNTMKEQEEQKVMSRNAWKERSPYEVTASFDLLPIVGLSLLSTSYGDISSTNTTTKTTLLLPTLNLGFTYKINRFITVGAITAYAQKTKQSVSNYDNSLIKNQQYIMAGAAPRVRFDWIATKYFSLYSSLALGLIAEIDRDRVSGYKNVGWLPYVDFTTLGAKFGARVYGFFDCSVGTTGFLRTGIGYNFDYRKGKR